MSRLSKTVVSDDMNKRLIKLLDEGKKIKIKKFQKGK